MLSHVYITFTLLKRTNDMLQFTFAFQLRLLSKRYFDVKEGSAS